MISIVPGSEQEIIQVRHALGKFNHEHSPYTQKKSPIYFNFVAKTEQDNIIGGIVAHLYNWNILFVDVLWINESHQRKGLGRMLLETVIDDALKMGCTLVHLDTFDFQAKDFYLKQGFEVFGVLEDCPPGHKRYYLKKKLP